MRLLRELSRRKLRTTLTMLGITIGIWALVVFSSMANKINTLVASGSDYYVGKIIVTDGSTNGLGIGLVPIDVGAGRPDRGAGRRGRGRPAGADAVRRPRAHRLRHPEDDHRRRSPAPTRAMRQFQLEPRPGPRC